MKQRFGFSIVEVMIALAVLSLAAAAFWSAAASSLRAVRIARQELQAAQLAQEGIEIVRSMRDDNYVRNWRKDGVGQSPGCVAGGNWRTNLCNDIFPGLIAWKGQFDERFLEIQLVPDGGQSLMLRDTNGFLQYSRPGVFSNFRRVISVTTPLDDPATTGIREDFSSLRVTSTINWCPRPTIQCSSSQRRSLTVEDELWNWFGSPP